MTASPLIGMRRHAPVDQSCQRYCMLASAARHALGIHGSNVEGMAPEDRLGSSDRTTSAVEPGTKLTCAPVRSGEVSFPQMFSRFRTWTGNGIRRHGAIAFPRSSTVSHDSGGSTRLAK